MHSNYKPTAIKVYGDYVFAVGRMGYRETTTYYVLNRDLKVVDFYTYKQKSLDYSFASVVGLEVFKHRGMIHGLVAYKAGFIELFVFRKSMITIIGNCIKLNSLLEKGNHPPEIQGLTPTNRSGCFLVYGKECYATIRLR